MLAYSLLMFFILVSGGIVEHKSRKVYLGLNGLVLIVLSGLRSRNVGIDTLQYYYSYKMFSNLTWNQVLHTRYEYGYSILCKLLNYISEDSQLLFIVTSIVITVAVFRFFYRYSYNLSLSVFLYVSLGYFYSSMNVMRQYLAMAIALWGISYAMERKFIRSILFVCLAAQFHTSAYCALIYLVFQMFPYTRKTFLAMQATGVAGFFLAVPIYNWVRGFSERYAGYSNQNFAFANYFATAINMLVALVILLFCIFCFRFDKDYDLHTKRTLETNILFACNVYMIIEIIAIQSNIFERMVVYFVVLAIIGLSNGIYMLRNLMNKRIFLLFIIVFTYLENMVILYYRPYWTGVVPFQFFWNLSNIGL